MAKKFQTLAFLNKSIRDAEVVLKAADKGTEEWDNAKEELRSLKEDKRIMAYKAKSFTANGHLVRL